MEIAQKYDTHNTHIVLSKISVHVSVQCDCSSGEEAVLESIGPCLIHL